MPCSLVVHRHFGGTYCLRLQGKKNTCRVCLNQSRGILRLILVRYLTRISHWSSILCQIILSTYQNTWREDRALRPALLFTGLPCSTLANGRCGHCLLSSLSSHPSAYQGTCAILNIIIRVCQARNQKQTVSTCCFLLGLFFDPEDGGD
jgi:hypothetical protein